MILKKKVLIFDFDGVLADSFNTFYSLMRDVMKHVGLSLTSDQYRNFFIGNVHQSIRDFINNDKKYEMAIEFRNSNYDKYFNDKLHKAKLFPGAIRFLKEVSKDHFLTIASSGRLDNLKDLLEKNGIKDLFCEILANMATSKEGAIKEIMNKFQAVPKKTIMITDTVGDVKVAKKCGLKTIVVTWGFHDKKTLMTAHPDYVASDFKTIESILKSDQAN